MKEGVNFKVSKDIPRYVTVHYENVFAATNEKIFVVSPGQWGGII